MRVAVRVAVGVRVAVAVAVAVGMPVPVRGTAGKGLDPVTLSAPVRAPVLLGVKVTETLQLA